MRSKDIQPNMTETGTPFNEILPMNDKINLVGKLAAGVAHEIRNPLTSIKGFVQLLNIGVSKPEYFSLIYTELNRVEEILDRFVGLAEPHSINFQIHDVGYILEQTIILLKDLCLSNGIEIVSITKSDTLSVFCDEEQLQLVFVSVIKNAIAASAPNNKLFISCTKKESHVDITIKDQGVGIPQERLDRLFEPFYCIKENGTGLGLMVSYKIIKEHHGTIKISSETGVGTTVNISLPLLNQPRIYPET